MGTEFEFEEYIRPLLIAIQNRQFDSEYGRKFAVDSIIMMYQFYGDMGRLHYGPIEDESLRHGISQTLAVLRVSPDINLVDYVSGLLSYILHLHSKE